MSIRDIHADGASLAVADARPSAGNTRPPAGRPVTPARPRCEGNKPAARSPQPAAQTADPAGTGLAPAGDGRMWWHDRFRRSLCRLGLSNFDAVMASPLGECLRVLEDRENWRLELPGPQGKPCGAYLKKHHVCTWLSRLRAKLRAGPGKTAGRIEAENLASLRAEGIGMMNLVAYGERLHANGLTESFVLTEELSEYTELGVFLRRRFATGGTGDGSARDRDLARLIRRVALLVRRFHAAGYNHRDLYCCHVFVKEPARGRFEIRLIDLQRAQRRRRFRRRWLVKDLAQLAWSAPREQIKCTHRMAFIRHYLGVGKLRPADKRLVRRVLARQQTMERRSGMES